MAAHFTVSAPFTASGLGGRVALAGAPGAESFVAAAEADPAALPALLAERHGLLLVQGMDAMIEAPALLLRLSQTFGAEIENYRTTGAAANQVHASVPEILVVSNTPPVHRAPPPKPEPPLTADGQFPVQYPHRRGWHTDQSFRRPPPDVSLFLAVLPVPPDQGQTLFADGTAAYAGLDPAMRARIDALDGIHVSSSAGRRREAVAAGEAPKPLKPGELPQRQPLARIHPVTGARALYLCEHGQMDWLEGPIAGLEPGPSGEGARLLDALMAHLTQRNFVYVHEWAKGDVLIWDNRCTAHAATWFDAEREARIMWRTTVSGNPGAAYAGEAKSWLAAE